MDETKDTTGWFCLRTPVRITDGTLRGLQAVVFQVMPGRDRVAVLMNLLGRQSTIELTATSLMKEGNERAVLFHEPPSQPPVA